MRNNMAPQTAFLRALPLLCSCCKLMSNLPVSHKSTPTCLEPVWNLSEACLESLNRPELAVMQIQLDTAVHFLDTVPLLSILTGPGN